MTIPTSEEIEAARQEISRDGLASEVALRLAILAGTDPVLRAWVEHVLAEVPKMAAMAPQGIPQDATIHGALRGALMYGMNLGLRIGAARAAAAAPTPAPGAPDLLEALKNIELNMATDCFVDPVKREVYLLAIRAAIKKAEGK